ncbi:unnamed protein product [Lymnaea stagnalis]|uniref:Uncharacterized protein n=1 Tax=Lymnaea stagnalis TaxID=6523 RepID=A0AAV2HUT4_LYMST
MTTPLVNPEVNLSGGIGIRLVLPDGYIIQKRIFENCTAFELKMEHLKQEQLMEYRVELKFYDTIRIVQDAEEFGRDNLIRCDEVRIVHSQSEVQQAQGKDLSTAIKLRTGQSQ